MNKIISSVWSLICEWIFASPSHPAFFRGYLLNISFWFLLSTNLPLNAMPPTASHILMLICALAFAVSGLELGVPRGDLFKGQTYNFTYTPPDDIVSMMHVHERNTTEQWPSLS
ncbi:hypothetical protein DE146DRAFT_478483 [Phaeosphaeria sp. MPI-PUGE-AT-0046c]|nr:hypothetical protein DE146DRAFT_478483 [Phaeosphaeria sp. MPI-PUGE-AT-0046c]